MDLGRVGIWTHHLNFQPTSKVRDAIAKLEALGYGAIWVGKAAYREPLASAAVLGAAVGHESHGDRHRHRQHLGPRPFRHAGRTADPGRP
jgi:hypothetical protein